MCAILILRPRLQHIDYIALIMSVLLVSISDNNYLKQVLHYNGAQTLVGFQAQCKQKHTERRTMA